MTTSINCLMPENLQGRVSISTISSNYNRRGEVSSYEVDITIRELALHKVCKSSDLEILKNKIEKTLEDWGKKYEKHQKNESLQHTESQAKQLNEDLEKLKEEFSNVLRYTLDVDDTVDWDSLKCLKPFSVKPSSLFSESGIKSCDYIEFDSDGRPLAFKNIIKPEEPLYDVFFRSHNWLVRTFMRSSIKHNFELRITEWKSRCELCAKDNIKREETFRLVLGFYEKKRLTYLTDQDKSNELVEIAKSKYMGGNEKSVEEYCDMVLANSKYPEVLNMSWKVNYNSDNKTVVIDYFLPSPKDLPLVDSYKFIKSKNEIETKSLPASKAKELYNSLLFQICIRSIHEVFEADLGGHVGVIAFNGIVTSTNPGTGNVDENVIMSVLSKKDEFLKINLRSVVAEETFRHLGGISGKSLFDLTGIAPILSVKKFDKAS